MSPRSRFAVLLLALAACARPDAAGAPRDARAGDETLEQAFERAIRTGRLDAIAITMGRSGCCFVECPIYTVEIRGDGRVVVEADADVAIPGIHEGSIEAEEARALVDAFVESGFLQGPEVLDVAFGPSNVRLTFSVGGLERSMATYPGADSWDARDPDLDGRRRWIAETAARMDALAGSHRWVVGAEDR